MSDALTPLRRAYGVEAPVGLPLAGADRTGPPGAGGPSGDDAPSPAETALLLQTRTAVAATVAAQNRQPDLAVVAAILAEAARTSAEALAPFAAVRTLYGLPRTRSGGEPATSSGTVAETALLAQSRMAVEHAARPHRPSDAVVSAVLARAADASRMAPAPDSAVTSPALAPLAVAYGLPLAAAARVPASVETALLVQTRSLLDTAPASAGPSEAAVAAVLARAAARPTPRAAAEQPSLVAADRSPIRAARSARRVGAWASGAVLAVALVVVLLPRSAGAPEAPTVGSSLAGVRPVPSVERADNAADSGAPAASPVADLIAAAPTSAPVQALAAAPDPSVLAASPAFTPLDVQGPAAPRPSIRVPSPAPPPPVPARAEAPLPSSRAALSQAPTTALASTAVSAEADKSWDAPDDVRVLSLRLQELRRGNAGLGWDASAEAFGAPTTGPTGATPGLRNVRETVPAGRLRLRTEPDTGDR